METMKIFCVEMKSNNRKQNFSLHVALLSKMPTKIILIALFGLTFFITGYYYPRGPPGGPIAADLKESQTSHNYETTKRLGLIKELHKKRQDIKHILVWSPKYYTPFFKDGQNVFIKKNCRFTSCHATANRNLFGKDVTKFHAIAFNGRGIIDNNIDLPASRAPHQKYVFFNMESADNYPICSSRWNGFFNWTATYKLDSEIPFPYIQIRNQEDEVVGPKRNMKWHEFDASEILDYSQNKTKAVAWFVSNCRSRSNRSQVAAALAESLKGYGWTLDIYGSCGEFTCPRFDHKYDCGGVLKRDYFFYLSFENSFSEDYVTEKLLTALQHDVVPIVLGGADYSRFLPPGSYLDALESSPRELAARINHLIKSPSEYNKFFRWKSMYRFRDPSTTDSVCAMCEALHNTTLLSTHTSYTNFRHWWHPNFKKRCAAGRWFG